MRAEVAAVILAAVLLWLIAAAVSAALGRVLARDRLGPEYESPGLALGLVAGPVGVAALYVLPRSPRAELLRHLEIERLRRRAEQTRQAEAVLAELGPVTQFRENST